MSFEVEKTGHNIGEFERAVAQCEKARDALHKTLESIEYRSVGEFFEYYTVEYCKKYSFIMRISKEEKELIEFRRTTLKKEDYR